MGLQFHDDTDEMGMHSWQKPGLLFIITGLVFSVPGFTMMIKVDWNPEEWEVTPMIVGGAVLAFGTGLILFGVLLCGVLYQHEKGRPINFTRCLRCCNCRRRRVFASYEHYNQ